RRAPAPLADGRCPVLDRAAPARGGIRGARDDDVARDWTAVRPLASLSGATGWARLATWTVPVLVAIAVPMILVVNGFRVLATDTFVEWELGRDGFPPDLYGFTVEQRTTLTVLGLRSIEPGTEGILLLERARLSNGAPAFEARELRH